MPERSRPSRRDFLSGTAKSAAVAGLAAAAGCASTGGPHMSAEAGPMPQPIKPDQKIRLGFVGVGGRGGGLLNVALNQENVTVRAISDIDDKNRNAAADRVKKKLGVAPELYTGPEDYKRLAVREDLDALVLATPCYLHGPMYLTCFAAGKHFYGEKPLCLEVGQANALLKAQQKNPHLIAQIGFQRRANPIYQQSIQALRDGAIGRLIAGRGAYNTGWGPFGVPTSTTSPWFGRRKFSGDWMLEQAVHSWDSFNWAANEMPKAAMGLGHRDIFTDLDPQRDITDYYIALLEYPCGLTVTWEHSWFFPTHDEYPDTDGKIGRFTGVYERIAGPKGGIDMGEGKIYPRKKEDKVVTLPAAGQKIDMNDLAFKAFLNSLRTGSPPISGVENGRAATLTGLLVRKSVDEGRRVLMTDIV